MRKLLITNDFQKQIDLFHNMVGDIEWSGVLFYKVDTNLADQNCIVTPKFIFPMDVGNSAFTTFDYSDVILDAYDVFPEAEECREGIIHTHHRMGAFFSGTDDSELKDNAENYDFYLSLVVDYKKSYKAKVATKPTSTKVVIDRPSGRFEIEVENKDVFFFNLDVEYENIEHLTSPMSIRMQALMTANKDRMIVEDKNKKFSNGSADKFINSYNNNYNRNKGGFQIPQKAGVAGPELPFQGKNTQQTRQNTMQIGVGETNKKITTADKQYEFLSKWFSQNHNCTTILYRTLIDSDKEYRQFTDKNDRQDSLEFFEGVMEESFDEFFTSVYGKSLDNLMNIDFAKGTSPTYLIDKFINTLTTLTANEEYKYIIDIGLRVLQKIRKEVAFVYNID